MEELRAVLGSGQDDIEMINGHAGRLARESKLLTRFVLIVRFCCARSEDNGSSDSQLSSRVQETSHLISLLAKRSSSDTSGDLARRQDTLAKEVCFSDFLPVS